MFSQNFEENRGAMRELLRVDNSFDMLTRAVLMNGKRAELYFVDGMVQAGTLDKILELLLRMPEETLGGLRTAEDFAARAVPYGETDVVGDQADFATFVLSGCVGLLLEGYDKAVLIDVREYPARQVTEPENDRVLRGPREGFVESLLVNTAMVRRHIRDPRLTMELIQAGGRSHTDVVLCYLEDRADPKVLGRLRGKLRNIKVNTLTMGLQSLTECMARGQWWNPFPRARYTERPDTAAASVAEGQVLLLMDNTPAGMILPTGILDSSQATNDYCFLPFTGTYLRWLRLLVSVAATIFTPLWYLLVTHPDLLPEWLRNIRIHEPIAMPVLAQLLIIEGVVGALKLASLNTPPALSGSFAVIGALVLGEFAVRSELLVPEAVLLMAFVAVANFAQPSYELGYALMFARIAVLLLAALLGWWGLLAGGLLLLLAISCTKTIAGTGYWYPLVPFNGRALSRLFIRRPITKDNS
ncbi:MAG: spore germination protein [Oscillospiraceae bacterium]|jgi:stage V sporulation protein AF|nr:spore germination protein [Oscillospiraceae bacterium]